jgi:hypothetical protein
LEKQCFPKCKKNELAQTWHVRITWKLKKKTTYKSHEKLIWQNCSTAETISFAKQEKPSCFLCFAMQSGNNSQKSQRKIHKHKCTTKHKKLPE